MSDNEDYMSDKILEECAKSDARPSLLYNKSQKRVHEHHKKQVDEHQTKRPKSYKEQEKETREKGLRTAIPSSNVGFKLLQRMGFKEGESLGKNSEGIKEPVSVVVKETSSGVGREKHVEEVISMKHELKEKILQSKEHEFKQAISERNMLYILSRDYTKAQRVCEELDTKNKGTYPKAEHFWTRATMKKLKEPEEDEDSDENEPPEEITHEKLNQIIDYLRSRYLYCLYCGFVSQDVEELQRICPGPYRPDHDDEI